jgi:hypothetical protein
MTAYGYARVVISPNVNHTHRGVDSRGRIVGPSADPHPSAKPVRTARTDTVLCSFFRQEGARGARGAAHSKIDRAASNAVTSGESGTKSRGCGAAKRASVIEWLYVDAPLAFPHQRRGQISQEMPSLSASCLDQ